MATFTYTPWVIGEVITANKLNSNNCKLVLTQEDIENGFEITIPTGLSVEDFFGMMVKGYDNISKINIVMQYNKWLFIGLFLYYNPTTGTLQSTQPDEEEQ